MLLDHRSPPSLRRRAAPRSTSPRTSPRVTCYPRARSAAARRPRPLAPHTASRARCGRTLDIAAALLATKTLCNLCWTCEVASPLSAREVHALGDASARPRGRQLEGVPDAADLLAEWPATSLFSELLARLRPLAEAEEAELGAVATLRRSKRTTKILKSCPSRDGGDCTQPDTQGCSRHGRFLTCAHREAQWHVQIVMYAEVKVMVDADPARQSWGSTGRRGFRCEICRV